MGGTGGPGAGGAGGNGGPSIGVALVGNSRNPGIEAVYPAQPGIGGGGPGPGTTGGFGDCKSAAGAPGGSGKGGSVIDFNNLPRYRMALVLIAHSGRFQPEDVERARRVGFDHHVAKPAGNGRLRALVNSSLAGQAERCLPATQPAPLPAVDRP